MNHDALMIRRFQRVVWTGIAGLALLLSTCVANFPAHAVIHPDKRAIETPTIAPATCPVPSIDQKEKVVGAGFDVISGKYWRTYDLDGNRKADYHVEYDIKGVRADKTLILSVFPVTYYLDTTGQGFYNEVWIDVNGNGKCEDLRPYTGREVGS